MSFASTVLVVDDDPLVCTLMQRILEDGGYHVLTAHNGGDALDALLRHGHEIRLLVTDVLMPGMSGPTLAKAAQLFSRMPVLYVSGYLGNDEDQVPAAAFLQKPFTPSELLALAEALMAPAENMALIREHVVAYCE
jgi:two-component system, cell cycle sensor histidine kinase and response regulator CckA